MASLSDPTFPNTSAVDGNLTIPDANGWGLRIVDSNDISIYGAGLYSFFNDYSTDCSAQGVSVNPHPLCVVIVRLSR